MPLRSVRACHQRQPPTISAADGQADENPGNIDPQPRQQPIQLFSFRKVLVHPPYSCLSAALRAASIRAGSCDIGHSL